MALKRLSALVLGLLLTALPVAAETDPIDTARISRANLETITIINDGMSPTIGRLYAASYDDEGRLIDVNSASVHASGSNISKDFSYYSDLGFVPGTIKDGSKLMLWSTVTNEMRPASNFYSLPKYMPEISYYSSADNNPNMVVERVISSTDNFGNPVYTIIGYQNGGKVRYNINEYSLIAKMTDLFSNSIDGKEYAAEEVWNSFWYGEKTPADVLKPGDIIGIDDSDRVYMIMVDSAALIDGVKWGDIPLLYNCSNLNTIARDGIYMGPAENVETDDNHALVTFSGRTHAFDMSRSIDTIIVSPDGTARIDANEVSTFADIIPFDEDTNTGDYMYARYANKGALQEMYIYRFE